MRAVVQRVLKASVVVGGNVAAEIGKGIVAFAGFCGSDGDAEIKYVMDKITALRIFEDDCGKMNLSVKDVGGEILIIPNFTVYGDARKGKRPSYSQSAPPEQASGLFDRLVCCCGGRWNGEYCGVGVRFGVFQADMTVRVDNDGPVTVLLDSGKLF